MINTQEALARNTDPVTSHMAGEAIRKNGRQKYQQDLVERLLQDSYKAGVITRDMGITSKELADLYDQDRYMVARRLPELMRSGRALRTDKDKPRRRCRESGAMCMEWWPSEFFMDQYDLLAKQSRGTKGEGHSVRESGHYD